MLTDGTFPYKQVFWSVAASGIVMGFGFLRDVVIATVYGLNAGTDGFFAAFIVLTLLAQIFTSSATLSIVPEYKRAKGSDDPQAVPRLVFFFVILLPAVFIAAGSVYILIETRGQLFSARAAGLLLAGLFLYLFMIGNALRAFLQAGYRFMAAVLPESVIPLMTILFMLLFHERWSVHAIYFGMISGALFFVLMLGWCLRKEVRWSGVPFLSVRKAATAIPKESYFMLPAISMIPTAMGMIDQSIALGMPQGTLSTWVYAIRLPDALGALLATGLASVLFPFFADGVMRARVGGRLVPVLKITGGTAVALLLPVCLLAMNADLVIRLLFARGAFDAGAVQAVGGVFRAYIFTLIPGAIVVILMRHLLVCRRERIILGAFLVQFAVKIGLNFLLVPCWGLQGMAMASIMAFSVGGGIMAFFIVRSEIRKGI